MPILPSLIDIMVSTYIYSILSQSFTIFSVRFCFYSPSIQLGFLQCIILQVHQWDAGWFANGTPSCRLLSALTRALAQRLCPCLLRPCLSQSPLSPGLYGQQSGTQLSFPWNGFLPSKVPDSLCTLLLLFHCEFSKHMYRANTIIIFVPANIFAFQLGSFFISDMPSLGELF